VENTQKMQSDWQVGRVLRRCPSWCWIIWVGRFCWMSLWHTIWL